MKNATLPMKYPAQTYRLQFNHQFTFQQLKEVLNYFKKMGVDTLYASPIFKAVKESVHGYDVVNPHQINSEIGSLSDLKAIQSFLKKNQMMWLQDIVPNHMAFHPDNEWLMDVLEKGNKSRFRSFFDTPFSSNFLNGKLMVPFLGRPLQEVIKKQELQLIYKMGRFYFQYFDACYPLNLASYKSLIKYVKLDKLLQQLEDLEDIKNKEAFAKAWESFIQESHKKLKDKKIQVLLNQTLQDINQSQTLLKAIINKQYYEFCYWQDTSQRINYRRFFTVNGLLCLNIQDEVVFKYYHQFIKNLLDQDLIQALRLDHIDGLYNPTKYLQQLKKLVGDKYIVAEKILEKGEELPSEWEIAGTSGYDFLGLVNNLLTYSPAEEIFNALYQEIIHQEKSFEEQVLEKKANFLFQNMQGELYNLCKYFHTLKLEKDASAEDIKQAIAWFLVYMPVYRFYGDSFPLAEEEFKRLKSIFIRLKADKPEYLLGFNTLEDVILNRPQQQEDKQIRSTASLFYKRLMQFSGPLMAKGVEDTLMYTNFRFIGHNEVGDHPECFGISTAYFHQWMQKRQALMPLTLNTTSTHDTKRGEDARARLNVLTHLPNLWIEKVRQWRKMNQNLVLRFKIQPNDEYFIYQNLVGNFPMQGSISDDFLPRFEAYLVKALREGKIQSDWNKPNESYENSVKQFVAALLNPEHLFMASFQEFHQKIAPYGVYNALVQLLLKFTCPGVPDVYQGTELWDFTFVDPDNRQQIDFKLRNQYLDEIQELKPHQIQDLLNHPNDAKIKLWLTQFLIHQRKQKKEFYAHANYQAVSIAGKFKEHLIAFKRVFNEQEVLVVAVLHPALLCEKHQCKLEDIDWGDTQLLDTQNKPWRNLITEEPTEAVYIKDVLSYLPFAILESKKQNKRSAGVLLHISSLPSAYGMGNLGEQAYQFIDFLKQAQQRYWQILPLTPLAASESFSPYSSWSSMAGNNLFIALEPLVEEGYLQQKDLDKAAIHPGNRVDYLQVEKHKKSLLKKAWQQAKQQLPPVFEQFCHQESYWLNDYALFMALHQQYKKPWYQWPSAIKKRELKALTVETEKHQEVITEIKWQQYLFDLQWRQLKAYAKQNDVEIIGDLPFYVNHQSADVWAQQDIFALDEEGKIKGIAGVPPDYFNEDGQLWGMPVFSWDVLKKQNYDWWLKRLQKNIQWFDVLRLDHFRAFYDYWEVPAGAQTAKDGTWKEGPGADFFDFILKHFPEKPFIAEDLGDVNQGVFLLRDQFELAGMKVLQFSFGDDMPQSLHTPHHHQENFFVYSGTHDNNTLLGWYKEAGNNIKANLNLYCNKKISQHNVAEEIIRMAYASVCKTAIIPLQDILNLDEQSRMNLPGTTEQNWSFKLVGDELKPQIAAKLAVLTKIFHRS